GEGGGGGGEGCGYVRRTTHPAAARPSAAARRRPKKTVDGRAHRVRRRRMVCRRAGEGLGVAAVDGQERSSRQVRRAEERTRARGVCPRADPLIDERSRAVSISPIDGRTVLLPRTMLALPGCDVP